MISWIDIAKNILEKANQNRLHVDEIAKEAIKLYSIEIGNDFENVKIKINNSLYSNVNSGNPIFKKFKNNKGTLKKGIYGLRNRPLNALRENIRSRHNFDIDNTLYIGKAGEYAVFSELMFRGYNASIMSVDEGIDIIAEKNNIYYRIQVKTARSKNNDGFQFNIKKSSFDANNSIQTFYIFVLRHEINNRKINDFAIFHNIEITSFLNSGVLLNQNQISIRIKLENNKYILGRNTNITGNINNFNI